MKAILRSDPVTAVVFYMSLVQLPIGLAGALFAWVWPVPRDVPWILAMGATSLTAHYSMGRALSLGDASFVLPIDFLRLPCIALAALLLFGEAIDGFTAGRRVDLRGHLLERPPRSAGRPGAAGPVTHRGSRPRGTWL